MGEKQGQRKAGRSQADRFPWAELLAVAVAFYIASAIGIPVRGFLLGAVSAMAGAAVAHPLDLVKVRLQMQTDKAMGMAAVARTLYVTGGVAAFFKGVEATLLRQFVYSGTRFAVYEGLGTLPRLLRASVAGVIGAFVGSPAEVALVRLQAGVADGGVLRAIAQVRAKEGFGGLWSGLGPLCARAIVVTIGQLAGYDIVKGWLVAALPDGPALHALSSVLAGFLSAGLSNPVDVVKTRLQASGDSRSVGTILQELLQREGARSLAKGLTATCSRMVPYVTVMLFTNESLKKVF